ncbi:MAG: flavin reductase family protein [Betaproteobacteria bacterium]|nr:flavin reductase family protein [Betaproteobacteria bacterium]
MLRYYGAHLVQPGRSSTQFGFGKLARADRYKLLVALVVPRPIALVTTLGPKGIVNAAPFSFFNVLGDDPPIVIVSVDLTSTGSIKDTARNIAANKEFVCHIVDEPIAEQMHGCAVEAPDDVSEVDLVGFTTAPSMQIKPPRIVEAPVAMECVLHSNVDMGTRNLFIGRILQLHVRDGIIEPQTLRRHDGAFKPIGRLYANRYCKLGEEIAFDSNQYVEAMKRMGKA